jgi:hypothetical protein
MSDPLSPCLEEGRVEHHQERESDDAQELPTSSSRTVDHKDAEGASPPERSGNGPLTRAKRSARLAPWPQADPLADVEHRLDARPQVDVGAPLVGEKDHEGVALGVHRVRPGRGYVAKDDVVSVR